MAHYGTSVFCISGLDLHGLLLTFSAQEFLDEHPGGPDVVTALAGKAIRVVRLYDVDDGNQNVIVCVHLCI